MPDDQTTIASPRTRAATTSERRRHKRKPVMWRGEIETRGARKTACAVLNLSLGGAKLAATVAAEIGETVKLSVHRFGMIEAKIVWRDQDHLGVRFLADDAAVAAMFGSSLAL